MATDARNQSPTASGLAEADNASCLFPAELMEQIFTLCTEFPVQFPLRQRQSPLNISQVCSYWRDVARQTKVLWSSIAYVPSTRRDRAAHIQDLGTIFERSYPLPLEVVTGRLLEYPPRFDLRLAPDHEQSWPLNPVRDVVIPYHDRLRVLRLSLSDHHLRAFLSISSLRFGSLEVLEISSFTYLHPDGGVRVFRGLPELRAFKLYSSGCYSPSLLQAPWAQLKILHIHQAILPSDALLILGQTKTVEDCSFVLKHESSFPDPQVATVFPSIKKLTINLLMTTNIMQFSFLKGFSVPNVDDLTIAVRYWLGVPDEFLPKMKRLTRLSLFHVSSQPLPLVDLLKATPYLVALTLQSPALDRAVLRILFDQSFTPHLQHVEFPISDLESLCDVLSERVKGVKTMLKSIIVEFMTSNGLPQGQAGITLVPSIVQRVFDSLGVEISLWSDVDGTLTLWYGPGRERLGLDAAALLREWHVLD
ncbi:hypothetical protein BDN72DRAFT_844721 [Pluteus cervinus]|uniref:Uncharacterized protein n=1 Tax=Pluteus cervinus TaxID=181527 RepID=A0ACD3AJT0_9AGAR|nr:hypothetical protein BDN72DRAFT_844721 [Pluteus cervinus]